MVLIATRRIVDFLERVIVGLSRALYELAFLELPADSLDQLAHEWNCHVGMETSFRAASLRGECDVACGYAGGDEASLPVFLIDDAVLHEYRVCSDLHLH